VRGHERGEQSKKSAKPVSGQVGGGKTGISRKGKGRLASEKSLRKGPIQKVPITTETKGTLRGGGNSLDEVCEGPILETRATGGIVVTGQARNLQTWKQQNMEE